VLFSEPKIPQWQGADRDTRRTRRFSALQRAENSSIYRCMLPDFLGCSFSALQRAENSSIASVTRCGRDRRRFQCSSASRKFLNSSGKFGEFPAKLVSVLFSEPKIPQLIFSTQKYRNLPPVSVLFSEPKIPQSQIGIVIVGLGFRFSALQRAENSSIIVPVVRGIAGLGVSVLFSEPKIPQSITRTPTITRTPSFSALQRAENSSILLGIWCSGLSPGFQCSSASRKFLNG